MNNLKLVSINEKEINIPNITSISFKDRYVIFTDSLGFYHKYESDDLLKFEFEFERVKI